MGGTKKELYGYLVDLSNGGLLWLEICVRELILVSTALLTGYGEQTKGYSDRDIIDEV